MEAKKTRVTRLLLIISLALAFAAQYYFAKKRDYLWDGVLLYLLAMAFFGSLVTRMKRSASLAKQPSWMTLALRGVWQMLGRSAMRLVCFGIGAGIVAFVAFSAPLYQKSSPYYDLLVLWGLGLLLAGTAFVDWSTVPSRIEARIRQGIRLSPEAFLVCLLILTTFGLRGVDQQHIPFVIRGDESAMGLEAQQVLDGRLRNPFATSWLSHPTLYFFIQALFLRLFGVSVAAVRFSSALISAFTVPFLYLFARRYFGVWVAILATLFFATYHYAIHYGRIALNNIWDPFFALSTLYFLDVGLEERRAGPMIVGGILLGLGTYFYMGAKLISIIVGLYIIYYCWRQRDCWRENLAYLIIYAFFAFLAVLPLLVHYRMHPSTLSARWKWVSVFSSEWVKAQMQRTGKSLTALIIDQFIRSILAFNYYHDPTFWYRPNMPLLQFLPSIFFFFGISFSLFHWRHPKYMLLITWFLLVIIFGGALLENPPSSRRLVLSIPVVTLFVVLGIVEMSKYIHRLLGGKRSLAWLLSASIVLFSSYQSLHFYYGVYTEKLMYADLNDEVANQMGNYLRSLGPRYKCYFLGPPRIYYGHPPILFLAQGVEGVDVRQPLYDRVDFVDPQFKAVFIILPERQAEFEVIRRHYPEGLFREFWSPKGQLLFVSYEVDI